MILNSHTMLTWIVRLTLVLLSFRLGTQAGVPLIDRSIVLVHTYTDTYIRNIFGKLDWY